MSYSAATRDPYADEPSIGFVFWGLFLQWRRNLERTLSPLNLTHPQFIALAVVNFLRGQQKPITQILIARTTGFDINMTSQVLRVLERKGYVKREKLESDSRKFHVTLTQLGKDKLGRALPLVESTDRSYFGVLGEAERDFYDCLNYLFDQNLEKAK